MTKSTRPSEQSKSKRRNVNNESTASKAVDIRRVAVWAVSAVVAPVALIVAGLYINQYWNRPQLSIAIAKALVGSQRVVDADGVREFRAVVDLQTPCVAWLVEYSAKTERIMPPPIGTVLPAIVYGVYVENVGRSEITDIRLTFRSRSGAFEVTGSPQLSLAQTEGTDPEGHTIRTVNVASMAPQSRGVIVGVLRVEGGSVSIEHDSTLQYKVNYSLGDADRTPSLNRHVSFSGARQFSDAPIRSMSLNALFTRQKQAFGLDGVLLPIDPVEMSAEGGDGSLRIIRAPFMGCPDAVQEGGYTVPIHQRGSDPEASGIRTTSPPPSNLRPQPTKQSGVDRP
jgi:hypothetical protein